MVNFGQEQKPWRLEWVLRWKVNTNKEIAPGVGRVRRTFNRNIPFEKIVVDQFNVADILDRVGFDVAAFLCGRLTRRVVSGENPTAPRRSLLVIPPLRTTMDVPLVGAST